MCYNIFPPAKGIALNAGPDEESQRQAAQAPNVVRAFAPVNKKTGGPDMNRAIPAYVPPRRAPSRGAIMLCRDYAGAVDEWNRRVRIELETERQRHEAVTARLEAMLIAPDGNPEG